MATLAYLKKKLSGFTPRMGLVLGSGWGGSIEGKIEIKAKIPYQDIPGFPVSTVIGHAGELLAGYIGSVPVICMKGRFHYYEGYSLKETTIGIRVMKDLGIKAVLLTNAAGGINETFSIGDLMVVRDHINFLGSNPLIGKNDETRGIRFPDMSRVYDFELTRLLHKSADDCNLKMREGVYLATSGPSFETPAEIRAFRTLGADAVGMSTVPEAIVARHEGIRVMGISCITNMAAGVDGKEVSHDDVTATAIRVGEMVSVYIPHAVQSVDKFL